MKLLWCWRCQMELPMLDEEEYAKALELYSKGIGNVSNQQRTHRFQELLEYYKQVTGWDETEPNAIMHHLIAHYGPPCENCGKPYRTPRASSCADCGNKRLV